jgi:hypothetical protein
MSVRNFPFFETGKGEPAARPYQQPIISVGRNPMYIP